MTDKPAAPLNQPRNAEDLRVEEVPVAALAAAYGTPLYVYSRAAIETAFDAYATALAGSPHLICYAVKANSNLAVLELLARRGAGFDIVSVGELERVLAAGGDPGRVVFSGVGKLDHEISRALEVGIRCFNVESEPELLLIEQIAAAAGVSAPVSIRVNPDVDARTHPYISTGLSENKFGVDAAQALALYRRAAASPSLDVVGIDCHIGSQLTSLPPFIDALRKMLAVVDALADEGIPLRHLDFGGGLGVRYRDEQPPAIADYVTAIREELGDRRLELMFEPGRSIVANAGLLLTRVQYLKRTPTHNFALVDAAMNDFIRPALYDAWCEIRTVTTAPGPVERWDIVGPVCETADFLGRGRELALAPGCLVAVMGAGAYGFVMSSNYNTRGRAAEVLVSGEHHQLVRERETIDDLLRGERRLAD